MFYSCCGKPLPEQIFFRGLYVFPELHPMYPRQQQRGKYKQLPEMPGLKFRLCSAAYVANIGEASNIS